MNRTEAHPIELLLLAALVVIEALLVLVAAGVALLLTLAQWRPAAAPAPVAVAEPEPIQALPQLHPLALLATELQALPATTLRVMAGTRSKRYTKQKLIELIACG